MRKKLLYTAILCAISFISNAQYNLTITYDASQGASTLQGLQKFTSILVRVMLQVHWMAQLGTIPSVIGGQMMD